MLLEETPAVLSLGRLCEDHGNTYHWTSDQKPHLTKKGKRINCNKSNYVAFVVPSTSSSTSSSPDSSTSSSRDSVIIGCAIWILISLEAAKTSNQLNQNPIPNYQERRDPYVERKRKSRNVPSLIATLLIKKNMMKSQTQQVRRDPYVDTNPQNVACWLKHVENDQTGTETPVTVDQKEEHNIDVRVPGLSHSVVKEAEHLRVQELVKRIETHLHREAFHADLQQNDVYNPFSKNSKRWSVNWGM